ncbi:hypothetical protein LDENG_00101930 [Lucifuga dentata]|nr:hypothetical protein LDENG_00101930 [Lucifuga dentata]
MTVNRFKDIMRYLHFVDNTLEGHDDKFFKLRPLLDELQANFSAAQEPEEFQSVDEQIIPFKGRHSTKQYIPKKTQALGFQSLGKSWCMQLYVQI